MEYSVKMTPHAVLQIEEIISYISHVLMSPESAKGWTDRLQKEIAGLSELPERFPLLDAEPWHSRGIRKMPV